MGRIRLLEDSLIDKIAAGEVVERPASVIKELLENAIDAGATRIDVSFEDGGRALVRVTDDGSGMSPEDAAMCVRRHATSKLRTIEELSGIATLGFRGEALPSIASVSRFTLTTRPHDATEGTRVAIVGGKIEEVGPAGGAVGTTIDVRDLFFNVPARAKFLKARGTESAQIQEICLRVALAHPSLRLVVTSDGKRSREYLPVADHETRTRTALGIELTTLAGARDGVEVRAMLSAPELARQGARGLHLFVNGRPIVDQRLARSVAFAYESVLPPGRYPTGAVFITIDPHEVDVNAHPQKAEVRFARHALVVDAVTKILARALHGSSFGGPVTGGPGARDPSFWNARLAPATPQAADGAPVDTWGIGAALARPATPYAQAPSGPSALFDGVTRATDALNDAPATGPYGRLRFLGQSRKTFLVCESDDGIVILDQHAADERIVYHRIRTAYADKRIEVQRLVFPERIELDEERASLVEAHADEILAMGLECSRIGPQTVAVHGVPALLGRASPRRLLEDLLEELSRTGERAFGDALDTAFATMACHAAIRAGDSLSPPEATALLRTLDTIDLFAGHCPHGRPVLVTLPFGDLERKLGR